MSEILDLAKSTYNRAYELVIEGKPEDLLEGLELAATSLQLWRSVGTEKNVAIGLWLYSRALQKSGARELALEAASQCVEIAETLAIDWMLASSLEALTRAAQGTEQFEEIRNRAITAISSIKDDRDKTLIESQFQDLR